MRVDRESGSPLGSPYLWEEERERTQACDAYARLMRSTMRHGGRACDGEWVRKVGRMAGYWGRVGEWDFAAARAEILALAADSRKFPVTLAGSREGGRGSAGVVRYYMRLYRRTGR